MSFINFARREIHLKLVYWGVGLGGKWTNVRAVLRANVPGYDGAYPSVDDVVELPPTAFDAEGRSLVLRPFLHLHLNPGALRRSPSRELVVRGADGLVLVCDSNPSSWTGNLEFLAELDAWLERSGVALSELPHVVQYNKRDLPEALPVDVMRATFNRHGAPDFEAVATAGHGVLETFAAIRDAVLAKGLR
ncbi:MAG: gliding-motility protein MglA [Myxococcales bacterium]|nr:gliding-motility protein MglA [Myxococcales bacterium]